MRTTRRSAQRTIRTEDTIKPTTACALIVLSLSLFACSGPTPKNADGTSPANAPESEKSEGPRRIIESGPLALEANNEQGDPTWKIKGEAARAGLQEDGENEFFITGVTGEIYSDGKTASTFTADSAKAVTESKKLVLDKNVKVTSLSQKMTLQADKITWMDDKQLFAAVGNVLIDSPDWQLGKMPEVWATPDLSKIGSPNKFK
ncbi:LPS export ABC transporter periplasmic protein LptC [Armatimonadetes bacterium Uphvl-Ar1]|nr:LPS export ABC transporter periplasmic protein LptC [Armatimonadetes bacterium Uphvl-Ar1]